MNEVIEALVQELGLLPLVKKDGDSPAIYDDEEIYHLKMEPEEDRIIFQEKP